MEFTLLAFFSLSTHLALNNMFDEFNRDVHEDLLTWYWPNYLSSAWTRKQWTYTHLAPSLPPLPVSSLVCLISVVWWRPGSTTILSCTPGLLLRSDLGQVTYPILTQFLQDTSGKDNFPSWKVINSAQRGVPRVDPGTENIGHKGSFSFSGDHFQPEQIKLEKECPHLPPKDKPHLELYGFMSLTMSQSSEAKPLHHNHYSSLSKSCFSSFLIIPDRNAITRNRAEKARTYNPGQAVVK